VRNSGLVGEALEVGIMDFHHAVHCRLYPLAVARTHGAQDQDLPVGRKVQGRVFVNAQ
jgi:hypothetical protein